MNGSLALLLVSAALTTLSACGKKEESVRFENSQREYKEALVPLVEKFAKQDDLGPCDRAMLPKMKEIAAALDARTEALAEYARNLPDDDTFRRVQVGPLIVRERKIPAVPREGWWSVRYGWKDSVKDFEKALASNSIKAWFSLNQDIRGMIVDDEDRIIYGDIKNRNYKFRAEFKRLFALVKDCATDTTCPYIAMTEEEFKWVREHTYYPKVVDEAQAGHSDKSIFQTRVASLLKKMEKDLSAFDTTSRKNALVTRKGNVLNLPLFLTEPFAAVGEKLASYIEPVWTSEQLRLKIDWKFDLSDLIFKVILGEGQGARAYVSRATKEIVFYSDLRSTTFGHEIGHVLGLPDEYYTLWHEESCEYEDQVEDTNLMSSSGKGSVLPAHWNELLKAYPAQN